MHKATCPLELNFRFFFRFLEMKNSSRFRFFVCEAFLNSIETLFGIFSRFSDDIQSFRTLDSCPLIGWSNLGFSWPIRKRIWKPALVIPLTCPSLPRSQTKKYFLDAPQPVSELLSNWAFLKIQRCFAYAIFQWFLPISFSSRDNGLLDWTHL